MKEFQSILRKRYRTDPWFQKFIGNLDPKTIMKILVQAGENGSKEEIDDNYSSRAAMLEELFDEDFCLTIKDRIQAPTYETIAEKDVLEIFENQGISEVHRICRPVSIGNIRRYLAPYYYNYKHPVAEFLYGDGYLQYFGVKD